MRGLHLIAQTWLLNWVQFHLELKGISANFYIFLNIF